MSDEVFDHMVPRLRVGTRDINALIGGQEATIGDTLLIPCAAYEVIREVDTGVQDSHADAL
jgi:hypothetical protein